MDGSSAAKFQKLRVHMANAPKLTGNAWTQMTESETDAFPYKNNNIFLSGSGQVEKLSKPKQYQT